MDCAFHLRDEIAGSRRGVVRIAHGMGEHIARYAGVIDALVPPV
jgi:alpha-beta hydrolase superfamily lysophospholipase